MTLLYNREGKIIAPYRVRFEEVVRKSKAGVKYVLFRKVLQRFKGYPKAVNP